MENHWKHIGYPIGNHSIGKPSGNHRKAMGKAKGTQKATKNSKWKHEKPDPQFENVRKSWKTIENQRRP